MVPNTYSCEIKRKYEKTFNNRSLIKMEIDLTLMDLHLFQSHAINKGILNETSLKWKHTEIIKHYARLRKMIIYNNDNYLSGKLINLLMGYFFNENSFRLTIIRGIF